MSWKDERDLFEFGTPSHLGYLKMAEGDSRRDKRRCIYYRSKSGLCKSTREVCYRKACIGSSHCSSYRECGTRTANKGIGKGRRTVRSRPKKKDKNYVPVYMFRTTTDILKVKTDDYSNGTSSARLDETERIKKEYLFNEDRLSVPCKYRSTDSGICNAPNSRNYKRTCGGVAGCPEYIAKENVLQSKASAKNEKSIVSVVHKRKAIEGRGKWCVHFNPNNGDCMTKYIEARSNDGKCLHASNCPVFQHLYDGLVRYMLITGDYSIPLLGISDEKTEKTEFSVRFMRATLIELSRDEQEISAIRDKRQSIETKIVELLRQCKTDDAIEAIWEHEDELSEIHQREKKIKDKMRKLKAFIEGLPCDWEIKRAGYNKIHRLILVD